MRLLQSLLVSLAFASHAFAEPAGKDKSSKDDSKASKKDAVDPTDEPQDTTFNKQTVPPIPMIKGDDFEKQISHGYWLIEAFSPYCGHCKHLAPKWQTLYEYYYTSDPLPASSSNNDPDHPLNSFSNYYDFKWGKLDCVASADTCTELDINMYPTVLLYKDGKQMKNQTGDHEIEKLMTFIEDGLEKIKPGSRPEGGVMLPEVGAKGSGLIEGKKREEDGTGIMPARKDSKDFTPTSSSKHPDSTKKASKHPTASSPDTPASAKTFAELLPPPYSSSVSLSPPDPHGLSTPLDTENFTTTVTQTLDPWLIKFYAPWCHHCKALAPSWSQMALDLKGKLNIGEVNCELHRALCKQNKVGYYPTIRLIRGPEMIEYTGLRGIQDMTKFALEAADSLHNGVPEVSVADYEQMEKRHDVTFIYFHDHATTSEDFMALERLPLHILGKAPLVKSSDADLAARFKVVSFPRLIVAKEGASEQYPRLMPKEMRDVPALSKWMNQNYLPLVSEVTASNAYDVMDGKYSVLALVDRARPEAWNDTMVEMKKAAIEWMDRRQKNFEKEREELRDQKAARVEEAEAKGDEKKIREAKLKKVQAEKLRRKGWSFAVVDTSFWERWVRGTFNVGRGAERVVVYDYEMRRYWDVTVTGSPILPTRSSILEVLPKITSSPRQLKAKITGSSLTYYPFLVSYFSRKHPYWAAGMVLPALAIFLWRRLRRRTDGKRRYDGKESLLGMTSVSNGKAD